MRDLTSMDCLAPQLERCWDRWDTEFAFSWIWRDEISNFCRNIAFWSVFTYLFMASCWWLTEIIWSINEMVYPFSSLMNLVISHFAELLHSTQIPSHSNIYSAKQTQMKSRNHFHQRASYWRMNHWYPFLVAHHLNGLCDSYTVLFSTACFTRPQTHFASFCRKTSMIGKCFFESK